MKTRFVPALVTLFAAACVSVINVIRKTELVPGLKALLFVIIGFYILGLIIKYVLNKAFEEKQEGDLEEAIDEDAMTMNLDTNDKIDELSNKSL